MLPAFQNPVNNPERAILIVARVNPMWIWKPCAKLASNQKNPFPVPNRKKVKLPDLDPNNNANLLVLRFVIVLCAQFVFQVTLRLFLQLQI